MRMFTSEQLPPLFNQMLIPAIIRVVIACFLLLFFNPAVYSQSWSLAEKVAASDRSDQDRFGTALSIDGNFAIVGVPMDSNDVVPGNKLRFAGSAYVFRKEANGNWVEEQKLVASDRAASDFFGNSVSISGNTAVIGCYNKNVDTAVGMSVQYCGVVYIFERDSGGIWSQVQQIVSPNAQLSGRFGSSLRLDSGRLIIGASGEGFGPVGTYYMTIGKAYIYHRDPSGQWLPEQELSSVDVTPGGGFGFTVALSGDYAIVGSWQHSLDSAGGNEIKGAGAVFIFEREISGNWAYKQKITSPDRILDGYFGVSIGISGENIIAGAFREVGFPSHGSPFVTYGDAYIFTRSAVSGWLLNRKLTGPNNTPLLYTGQAVAISGNVAVLGARHESEDEDGLNPVLFAGAAYLFENRPGGNWDYVQKIVPFDRGNANQFGGYVAAGHNYVIIGTEWDSYNATDTNFIQHAGSAYIFKSCFNMDKQVIVTQGGLFAGSSHITYQWLDCNNNFSAIPGATGQSFFPAGSGMYAVAITDGLCQDTSDCIGVVGVPQPDNPFTFNLYPNPTGGAVNIGLDRVHDEIRLVVRNSLGQILISQKNLNVSSLNFRIDDPPGLYLVEVSTPDHDYVVKKVLLQR